MIQIYRYSDFTLLQTIAIPPSERKVTRSDWTSQATGFGLKLLDDGSVILNTYECALYRLSEIDNEKPRLKHLHTIGADGSDADAHACGIPVQIGDYWIQPIAESHRVVVLDISKPEQPREVFDLKTPEHFTPHWLSKDPNANRLVLGAEMGHEQGFFVLRMDEATGALGFDPDFNGAKSGRIFTTKSRGYISFERKNWPHGETGNAWGHAALFLNPPTP